MIQEIELPGLKLKAITHEECHLSIRALGRTDYYVNEEPVIVWYFNEKTMEVKIIYNNLND